jgi:DNA repair photolyase
VAEAAAQRLRWSTVEEEAELALPGLGERVTHPEFAGIEFVHVRAKSLLNHVASAAGMPFEWTINPYRGCTHACTYCFARPSHTYLDLDAGRDFESVIVVKVNAVERLRAELRAPRWQGAHVALGTNTDPYQRCEGRYRLTRGIIETLAEAGNPFSVLTKGTLVTRDLDVLADAARRGVCTGVSMSIPTLDEEVWRTTEPGTPHPRARLEAIATLAEAGIPAGVFVAPIIPGISDGRDQLDAVVRGALEAGASSIVPSCSTCVPASATCSCRSSPSSTRSSSTATGSCTGGRTRPRTCDGGSPGPSASWSQRTGDHGERCGGATAAAFRAVRSRRPSQPRRSRNCRCCEPSPSHDAGVCAGREPPRLWYHRGTVRVWH